MNHSFHLIHLFFAIRTAEKHNCEFIKNSITGNLIENSSHNEHSLEEEHFFMSKSSLIVMEYLSGNCKSGSSFTWFDYILKYVKNMISGEWQLKN